MKIAKITDEELKRLEDCKTAKDWNEACDAIKNARGGQMYPDDWWEKVKESGMMDRSMARWGENSDIKISAHPSRPYSRRRTLHALRRKSGGF